jgi:sigma-B regulation protein RsbU (phosphoserine phosphatase)
MRRRIPSLQTLRAGDGRVSATAVTDARPASAPRVADQPWSARAMSRPATEFSGDFYFATRIGDSLWFGVGDFAGHGLEAALFTVMIQEDLERIVQSCRSSDPAEVVVMLDNMLRDEIPLNRFATLVVGRAGSDGSVQLVNAGHCYPILARADETIELLGANGPIIGRLPCPRWKQVTLQMGQRDRLIIHTDGLSEAADPMGDEFGIPALHALVRSTSPEEPLETFFEVIDHFTGGCQSDDMTMFVLTRN